MAESDGHSGVETTVRELPKPVDIRAALAEVIDRFEELARKGALIGGVALAYHGIERFTKDADLAVTVAVAGRARQIFADSDPRPLRIGGISVNTSSGVRVDLVDRREEFAPLFEEAIAAAQTRKLLARVGEHTVPVVPRTYLIALKLAADRPQDEVDIGALLEDDELDYPAARAIVRQHLGYFAARRLDRMARAAGRADAPADYENGD